MFYDYDISSIPEETKVEKPNQFARVLSPVTKKVGIIPLEYLEKASAQGYKEVNEYLHNAIETGEGKTKVFSPVTQKYGMIPNSHLAKALLQGYKPAEEASVGDMAQSFTKGVTAKLGKFADTAIAGGAAIVGAGIEAANVGMADMNPYAVGQQDSDNTVLQEQANKAYDVANDYWQHEKIEGYAKEKLDTGMNHLTSIRAAETAGSFVADVPMLNVVGKVAVTAAPLLKYAQVPFVDKMTKLLTTPIDAKTFASFAGAGAGLEIIRGDGNGPKKEHESRLEAVQELGVEVLRDTFGMILGSSAPSSMKCGLNVLHAGWNAGKSKTISLVNGIFGGSKLNPNLVTAAQEAGVNTKNFQSLAEFANNQNIKMFDVNENSELISYLIERDIKIPANMLSDGKVLQLIAETKVTESVSDTMMKKGKESLQKDLIEILDEKFGKLPVSNDKKFAGTQASEEAKTILQAKGKEWKATSDQMYDSVYKKAGQGSVQFNEETKIFNAINKMIETQQARSPDAAAQKLIDSLASIKERLSKQTTYGEILNIIKETKAKAYNASGVEKLQGLTVDYIYSDLQELASSEGKAAWANINGQKAFTGELPAKDFLDTLNGANQFYSAYIHNRLKTQIAQSILYGNKDIATEAYSLLNSKKNIGIVKHIFHDMPEVLNKLIGLKTKETLNAKGILTEAEGLNIKKFINTFGKDLRTEEDFRHLMDQKTVTKIRQNIYPIANALAKYKIKAADDAKSLNTQLMALTKTAAGALAGGLKGLAASATLSEIFSLVLNSDKAVKMLIQEGKATTTTPKKTVDHFVKRFQKRVDTAAKTLVAPTVEGYSDYKNSENNEKNGKAFDETVGRIIKQYPWLSATFY